MPVLNSVKYAHGHRVASVPLDELVHRSCAHGEFVWVALNEPTPEEIALVSHAFDLHELPVEDVMKGGQRPKVEDYRNFLFIVMQPVELTTEITAGELDIFLGKDFLLSVRNGLQMPFTDVRERAEREPELLALGPPFALYALMDAVVDRYFPVLDHIEAEIEAAEAMLFSGPVVRVGIQELYAVKQRLGVLKHATAPLLEAVTQITGNRGQQFGPDIREYFRDVFDHQAVSSHQDTVMTAITASLALSQLQDSQTTKRLASYAALIALPTFIAGVYGMNFEHMPEISWRIGYPLSLGLMGAIDAWLFWRFRRVGWL
jgi:magnesium transporter